MNHTTTHTLSIRRRDGARVWTNNSTGAVESDAATIAALEARLLTCDPEEYLPITERLGEVDDAPMTDSADDASVIGVLKGVFDNTLEQDKSTAEKIERGGAISITGSHFYTLFCYADGDVTIGSNTITLLAGTTLSKPAQDNITWADVTVTSGDFLATWGNVV